MNIVLDKYGYEYSGTDPMEDAEFAYKEKMRQQVTDKHERIYCSDLCSLSETKVSDPYEVFGFGILGYFTTLRGMMIAMAFMTIVFFPVMVIYN